MQIISKKNVPYPQNLFLQNVPCPQNLFLGNVPRTQNLSILPILPHVICRFSSFPLQN